MITGDKKDTAKNIAMACCLIDPDMCPDYSSGDDVTSLVCRSPPLLVCPHPLLFLFFSPL